MDYRDRDDRASYASDDRAVGCGCVLVAALGLGVLGWLPILWLGGLAWDWVAAHPGTTVCVLVAALTLLLVRWKPSTRRNARNPPGGRE